MLELSFLFLLTLSHSLGSLAARLESGVHCASNSSACETGDNLLSFAGAVASLSACRQLCYADPDCQYLTYFPSLFPFFLFPV